MRRAAANLGDRGCWLVFLYEPLHQVHVATVHSSMEKGVAALQADQGGGPVGERPETNTMLISTLSEILQVSLATYHISDLLTALLVPQ